MESEKLFCTKTTRISIYDPENLGKSPVGVNGRLRQALQEAAEKGTLTVKARRPDPGSPPFLAPSGTILYTL